MLGRLGDVKEGDLSGQDETPRPLGGGGRTAPETARPRVRVGTMRSEPIGANREPLARQESERP